jgi:hypothetical protein
MVDNLVLEGPSLIAREKQQVIRPRLAVVGGR